jgi:uncharacterized zinc-type alcohol dehydrogenase-like protein
MTQLNLLSPPPDHERIPALQGDLAMTRVRAYAATKPGLKLEKFEFTLPEMKKDELEVRVLSCGVCHSDLSMMQNHWGMTQYPLVPGHEVVGEVVSVGESVPGFKVGDRVGIGWYTKSCMTCDPCLGGHQNLCLRSEQTIVGRHGGFADRIRCHWNWATPIPQGLDLDRVGPLFCGGITVFGPIAHFDVKPTDRVGVIGIGGLGHLAVQFLSKWGCEVTAFTSQPEKADWIRKFGAHHVVASNDEKALAQRAGHYDFILNTANVTLPWSSYLSALAPNGRLHFVGAVLEPIPTSAFALISGQKSISGSPLGRPVLVRKMLEFCQRHKIETMIEKFPLSRANEALERVEKGDVRFRAVLINDFN